MDRTDEFRVIVRRVFEEVARMTPSEGDKRTELVCDDAAGHYQLGEVGWEGRRRIDNIYLHVDVYDDRVWLQHDGTNLRLADWLVREGVPKHHIVLAFHPAELRQYTDYATA
jgi:hypothetical protein